MPEQLTVDPACYEGNGLRVTAADYSDSPIGFEWTIRAVQDTTHVLSWAPKDEKIKMDASNTFTVPDSLVTNYQKLIITVAANCQGRLLHSIGYGFIKSKSAGSTCTVWKPISQ